MDVYINPDPVPTAVNQIWHDGRCDRGIVWGVTAGALPLAPGDILTLTVGDAYYAPEYSEVSWPLPVGTPVWAQVDSANADTDYGAVTAILGVGRIKARPAAVDGEICVRQTMWLSLTFDHRLVDGAPAARFLQRIKQLIEEPYLSLT